MSARAELAVVIPLHNNASTIGATLDSLTGHDVDLDVIVVDDASDDDGPAIARAHELAPRVLRSDQRGPSATRNVGVAAARADWLLFLDADDTLRSGALATRLARGRQRPNAVIVTRHALWFPDGAREAAPGFPPGDPRVALLEQNRMAIHAHLVPRAALERLGAAPFRVDLWRSEDWQLWLRLALVGVEFDRGHVVDCDYRQRAGATMTAPDAADDGLRALDDAAGFIAGLPRRERAPLLAALARGRARLLVWRAVLRWRAQQQVQAVLDVTRAVRAAPRNALALPVDVARRALAARQRRRHL